MEKEELLCVMSVILYGSKLIQQSNLVGRGCHIEDEEFLKKDAINEAKEIFRAIISPK